MAGKKPAKPMAGQRKEVTLDPTLYGTQVLYVGSKDSPAKCPKCGKNTVRGMVRMKNSNFYCSVVCVESTIDAVVE